MKVKSWLQEEKGGGGLGAILIVIIIAAAIYAVQVGPANLLYEPALDINDLADSAPEPSGQSENTTYTANTYPLNQDSHTSSAVPEFIPADSLLPVGPAVSYPATTAAKPNTGPEASRTTSASTPASTSRKTKIKHPSHRLSNEELIKNKLAQGKTVRQIANETGLDRKYIREVKRRSQQVIW